MPYITREDGERFIIPSYRDTLTAKKISLLKKELEVLSSSYGGYITLQKKGLNQYEVAFSPDSGYLLGECVWHYFKRPYDMVYCEEVAGTGEAILVIVKSGSVYLDGSFPVDTIPEELVIFKTQQNNFSIYINGDVPISETPEDGKFSFDPSSVRSFNVLPDPVFPTLPGVKAFQLQLVDTVLKSYGVGVLPIKPVLIIGGVILLLFFAYTYISTHQKELPAVMIVGTVNPYQGYIDQLTSPDPASEIAATYLALNLFYTIPGWFPDSLEYTPGFPAKTRAHVKSTGARTNVLLEWARRNNIEVEILPEGVYLTLMSVSPKRPVPTTITYTQDIVSNLLDRLSYVIPGNSLSYGAVANKRSYLETNFTLSFNDESPFVLDLIGNTLENLPIIISKISIKVSDTGLSGTITFKVLGN